VCEGLEVVLLFPSPKFQLNDVVPVEELVKVTASGPHPFGVAVLKFATGEGTIVTEMTVSSKHEPLSARSVTGYVPGERYRCEGFTAELLFPSPKFHVYEVIVLPFPVEEFVKYTLSLRQNVLLYEKEEVGEAATVIYAVRRSVSGHEAAFAISVTVYVPGVV
jgi:hypothetical protein